MWQNVSDLRSVQNEPLYFSISDLLPARMYSYRLYGVYEPLLGGTPRSAVGEATTFISASTYVCGKYAESTVWVVSVLSCGVL